MFRCMGFGKVHPQARYISEANARKQTVCLTTYPLLQRGAKGHVQHEAGGLIGFVVEPCI